MIPFARISKYGNTVERTIKKMEFGSFHYVLLDSTGNLYGAGTNTARQYYPGNVASAYSWILIETNVEDCWAGGTWTCYKKSGVIYYIGTGGLGSALVSTYTPLTSTQLGSVSMSNIHSIYGTVGIMHFVINTGAVYAIGPNTNANSGLNTGTTALNTLTLVSGLNGSSTNLVTYMGYAQDGTVLLHMENGYMYGWGRNTSGMLANANQNAVGVPKAISFGARLVTIGYSGMNYIVASGLWACGDQVYGQIGTGYTSGSSSYLTSIQNTGFTGSLVPPFISTKGTRNTWNNSFINTDGLWITGNSPQTLGSTSSTTLGVYTLSSTPVPIESIVDYGYMASTSTICSSTEIYQCGTGSRIIGVGSGTVIGFIKVPLPWE